MTTSSPKCQVTTTMRARETADHTVEEGSGHG